jgi:folate-dependent phosphoribosylglycinamide formyltransferase PurN
MYGGKVHAAVIAAGALSTGVTVHFVDEELDRGPRIAEWRIPVLEDDTPESLATRVLRVEHIVYPRVVDMVAALNDSNYFADF